MGYPLVNVYFTDGKDTPCSMGKLKISTGPFSTAMLTYQEVPMMLPESTILGQHAIYKGVVAIYRYPVTKHELPVLATSKYPKINLLIN